MELWGAACAGVRTSYSDVDVEIREGCGGEEGEVLFDPFGGANEGVFCGVPGGEDTKKMCEYGVGKGRSGWTDMLRRGFQPVFCSSLKALVISIKMAEPEFGSAAPPMIQASRWLPMMIVSFGFVPLIIPTTFQIDVIFSSIMLVRVNVTPGARPVLYVVLSPPTHSSLPTELPAIPCPFKALNKRIAFLYDISRDGIVGRLFGLLTRFLAYSRVSRLAWTGTPGSSDRRGTC